MDKTTQKFHIAGKPTIKVKALLLGDRINLRNIESMKLLWTLPLTLASAEGGCVIIFRYGAVIFFDISAAEEEAVLARVRETLVNPFPTPETEEVEIQVLPNATEGVQQEAIYLKEASIESLTIVAEVLAKTMVLDHYETSVAQNVETVESLIVEVKQKGFKVLSSRALMQQISNALLSLQEMVGFVGIAEKPDILWDHPEKERLFARLRDEYELRERHLTLDKKVELIFQTAQTLNDLLQTKRSLRVEWYIVILILFEIVIILYEIFLKK